MRTHSAPCSVVGASFSSNGTGYASIGCQYGLVLQFQPLGPTPFQFSIIGNAFIGAGLAGGSLTDVEVIF